MRRIALGLCIVLFAVTAVFAAKGIPLTATFDTLSGYGVGGDSGLVYSNGVGRVQVYLASGGGTLDLITYGTGRKLTFAFDPSSSAFQASGLPQNSQAEVDLYGINFYGPFSSMGVGTTALLKTSLQFKSGGSTYELAYPALAVKRTAADTWLITSSEAEVGGNPGFDISDAADLGVFRKRSRADFGTVSMPIHFYVTLK